MRVLHIAGALTGQMGGPTQTLLAHCIALTSRGWHCTIAAPKARDEGSEEILGRLRAVGVEIVEFDLDLRGRATMWGLSSRFLAWLLRHEREYDIVHTYGVWFLPTLAGLAIARVSRQPALSSPTASLTVFNITDTRSPWTRQLKRLIRPVHDWLRPIVLFSSEFERTDSWSRRLRGRSMIVSHALPDERFLSRSVRPDRGNSRVVGFLGRVDPIKNVGLLIHAIAMIDPPVSLSVAGSGAPQFEQELRSAAARAGVDGQVQWLGYLPPSEHAGFFGSVDVVAMPSKQESFGLAAAEAMAAGVPVIVTSRSGVAEVVARHGGGRVVEPELGPVRDAIADLLSMSSGSRNRLGEEAQAAAISEFGIKKLGIALESAYQEAIERFPR